ncbi:MAG: isochorismatase family protein [Acidobacteria bacterium]|nr:isochorismatase family protein [Acidobacteriota bacterium]
MRTVFFDIDTQIDFLFPAGALYAPGAERLLPVLSRLNHLAPLLVSSVDAHSEDDPEFRDWPPHCVAGTAGQAKPAATLLDRRAIIPNRRSEFSIEGARQIIVEKQALDVFTNPNLPALLDRLEAGRCVVYGVVTEYCVRFAALGLLATGRPVSLVTDAIQSLSREAEERMLAEFRARGGELVTAARVVS